MASVGFNLGGDKLKEEMTHSVVVFSAILSSLFVLAAISIVVWYIVVNRLVLSLYLIPSVRVNQGRKRLDGVMPRCQTNFIQVGCALATFENSNQ